MKTKLVKEIFDTTQNHTNQKKDDLAFSEFQNRLRQELTSNWVYSNGQTTIEYKPGYIIDLERALFNLLNGN